MKETTVAEAKEKASNPYLPDIATVTHIVDETPQIKTLRLVLNDEAKMSNFSFMPGQLGQLSVFGAGEATFVINSSPGNTEYLQFSVMKAGCVTAAISELSIGSQVGIRAPLGNWFDLEPLKGKNVLLIAGGIGLAPLRPLLLCMIESRKEFGNITLICGARSPEDLCYKDDLDTWRREGIIDIVLTIDTPVPDWGDEVGFVPAILEKIAPSPENTVAITCGPPIMIEFVLKCLSKLGFEPDNIITTLERRMKCGIGTCGRCNIGTKYVCIDGPIFTLSELNKLVPEL